MPSDTCTNTYCPALQKKTHHDYSKNTKHNFLRKMICAFCTKLRHLNLSYPYSPLLFISLFIMHYHNPRDDFVNNLSTVRPFCNYNRKVIIKRFCSNKIIKHFHNMIKHRLRTAICRRTPQRFDNPLSSVFFSVTVCAFV